MSITNADTLQSSPNGEAAFAQKDKSMFYKNQQIMTETDKVVWLMNMLAVQKGSRRIQSPNHMAAVKVQCVKFVQEVCLTVHFLFRSLLVRLV